MTGQSIEVIDLAYTKKTRENLGLAELAENVRLSIGEQIVNDHNHGVDGLLLQFHRLNEQRWMPTGDQTASKICLHLGRL